MYTNAAQVAADDASDASGSVQIAPEFRQK